MTMDRRKTKPTNVRSTNRKQTARSLWTGTINFGLVNIPVALFSAEATNDLDFDMLDRRDFSPIRYRRVNAKTGREVSWGDVIKGYQYEKGEYVALSDKDFQNANVEATRSIEITDLEPLKNGQWAYALLRDVMKKSGKIGVAKIVIRSRQHLAALLAEGQLLVVNVMRFPHELRDATKLNVPKSAAGNTTMSSKEDSGTAGRNHGRRVAPREVPGRIPRRSTQIDPPENKQRTNQDH
jgi:DNA end-binding protein Ku